MHIREHVSLKSLNTFGMDASARYFVRVESLADLHDLFTGSILKEHPHLILGGGSNILFTGNYPGVVVQIAMRGIEFTSEQSGEFVYVKACAGEPWDDFVG